MKIEVRSVGDVKILDCSGKLVFGDTTKLLRVHILDLLNSGYRKIILNLKDVTAIDSGGIGELVRSKVTMSNNEGKLLLLNLTNHIERPLIITKLIVVFDIFDDEEAALRSF